nr:immunoglobulin heavy chain junction region [Mus musculus]MBK4195099.1 immunoglobulin heavy chain junction region [Mus musculus]
CVRDQGSSFPYWYFDVW